MLTVLFIGIPRFASAGIEFLSTLSSRQADGGTSVFEDTRFRFSSDKKPVSFHFGGTSFQPWLLDPEDSSNAVLEHAYLGVTSRRLRTDISLGRIPVNEGITRESIDGIHGRTKVTSSTALSFFSGRTADSANDVLGGRLWCSFDDRTAAGVSYVTESAGPQTLREEAALDLRLRPLSGLSLSGRSLIDLGTGNWTSHSLAARIGPFRRATFLLDASLTDYGASGSPVRLPTVGAGVQHPLSRRLAVGFDVRSTEDPFAGTTFSDAVRISFSSLRSWSAGVSILRRRGQDLDALELSAQAAKKTGSFESSLDLQQIVYTGDASRTRNAASATLGIAYALSPAYKVTAEMQESRNVDLQAGFRGFVKLEYRFGS